VSLTTVSLNNTLQTSTHTLTSITHQRHNTNNRRFLEAPVSGSKVPAATGALVFLCAGAQDLFDEVQSTGLAAMGKASHFLNTKVGAGTRAKLVVNSLMGTMLAALAEGLVLGDKLGLNASTLLEIISQGAIATPMFALKGPKMVKQDHAPNFPLKHATKDMKLAADMAQGAQVEYSVMTAALDLYQSAQENAEWADQDFSAIMEQVRKQSKSE
jgi:3-hydroxyisobutyrate dehydrogenase-like beta-hydroxyacid dehydrogenase